MSRQKIVAGNWKMNKSLQEAKTLVKQIINQSNNSDEVIKIIIPPFPFLESVVTETSGKSNFYVGAQKLLHAFKWRIHGRSKCKHA